RRRQPLRAGGAARGAAADGAHAGAGGRGSAGTRPRGRARGTSAGRGRRRHGGGGRLHGLSRRLAPRGARLGGGAPAGLRRGSARRVTSRRPAVPTDLGRGGRAHGWRGGEVTRRPVIPRNSSHDADTRGLSYKGTDPALRLGSETAG